MTDLRTYISDLQKIRLVNIQFQTKLGELTLQLNNPQLIESSTRENILIFIKFLGGYLCHNYYVDYVSQKTISKSNIIQELNESNFQNVNTSGNLLNQGSVYDNSMNLILVMIAKISKIHPDYAAWMVDCFVEHINGHLDCFNYIISFYRLYINCSQIKIACKEYGLYNNLFELYKKIYRQSSKYESNDTRMKDLNNLASKVTNKSGNERKYFLENFKRIEQVKYDNSDDRHTESSMSENNFNFSKNLKSNERSEKSHKFSIFSTFKISNTINNNVNTSNKLAKSNACISKTDRKNIKNISNDFSGNRDEIRENSQTKRKVPELKFPVMTMEHHFSFTRSSGRNEFSKSGGSSTSHTKNLKNKNKANIPNIGKNEILIDGSNSMNRQYENDENLISPKEKLKSLALQLGESCLASDLAALMNQKRDLALGKIAKEKISKNINSSSKRYNQPESDYIDKLRNNNCDKLEYEADKNDDIKSSSKNNFNNNQNQLKNLLNKKPLVKTNIRDTLENNNSLSQNNLLDFTKDFKKNFVFSFDNALAVNSNFDKTYKNYIKIREIITNFILSCLKEFTIDEYHMLKINTNLIYCYFLLPSFEFIRKKKERKKCESLENFSEFSRDLKGLSTEGTYLITDNKDNLLKTILLNTVDKSQTISEEMLKSIRPNFTSREKASFESFLSVNLEDDKVSSLALKSEFEALHEILSFNSANVEHILKQQNFFKLIFYSMDNSEPEISEFWSNGVLFTAFSRVGIERVRKSSDNFLEKIKNRITYILKNMNLQANPHLWKTLKQQLDILSDYMSYSKSRIIPTHIIFEFTEILVILKKGFSEIFQTYAPFEYVQKELKLIEKPEYSDCKVPEELIELFSSYLDILAKVILNTQIFTCEKLLNDLFITCPSFLEILKFFTIYLFTKDISEKNDFNKINKLTISNANISNRNSLPIKMNMPPSGVKFNLINFIKEVDMTDPSNLSNLFRIFENYKDHLQLAISIIIYYYNVSIFYHKIVRKESLDKSKNEEKESNKYWVNSIREYMKYLYTFINSKTGLFYEYISIYGSYIKINSNHIILTTREKEINSSTTEKHNPIINFALTIALLNLQNSIFEFSNRFSFIVNESTSLDLIRVHYISFIKIYNKNLDFSTKLGDVGTILENYHNLEKKKRIKALIRDIYNDQNHLQVIINLCKLHLLCLLNLAKNRNLDVTNKFFQLKIVDFMAKEIDLEHNAAEKIYKIKNYLNNKQNSGNKNTEDSPGSKIKSDFLKKFNMNLGNQRSPPVDADNLIIINEKKLKEEKVRKKYESRQETVMEVGEDDGSKYSSAIKKNITSGTNNVSQIDEESFESKKLNSFNFNYSNNSKNIINEGGIIEKEVNESNSESNLNSIIDDEDEYDSDLSDVMLVDLKPKVNPYEDKIPKLSLIPNTISELSLGGSMQQKPDFKPNLNLNKLKFIENLNNKQEDNSKIQNKSQTSHQLINDTYKDNNTNLNKLNVTNKGLINLKDMNILTNPNNTANKINTSSIGSISHSFNSSVIKPDSVNLDFKEDKSSNIIDSSNNLLDKKKLNLFDIKAIPNSLKSSHRSNKSENMGINISNQDEIQNKNQNHNPDSKNVMKKLNLKTLKSTPDASAEKNKDVVNYAGNKGKIVLNKLELKNSTTFKEEEVATQINKQGNKDVEYVNIEHQFNSNEEINKQKLSNLKNLEKNLEKTLMDNNTNKIQIAFEKMLKKKYSLFYRKATMEEMKEEDLSNFNLFYLKERNNRLLYHDTELQVLIISLIMCLIITPSRGLLDELYCSYYPSYESNKMNILYLLHHHLNHADNQEIQPLLLKYVSDIRPTGAGQRLMKLLCISLFDISIYKDWDKIAFGAYGKVFQCSTNLVEPKTVAIKKIAVAENIYDFCHIFDIFTEITALETFRMEGCVTHLFDYGVDSEYYYIVMKRYKISLKEWRLQQTFALNDMLPIYLNLFKDILKAVNSIHNYKTTHYDLKCDNVVIDFPTFNGDLSRNSDDILFDSEWQMSVKIADFGECKMFLTEKDEYCVRSRGTNVIKSPEMLKNYGFQARTDDDNYDRRKKMGTTRSSDIWSLGCLFYELLTGKFLFEEIETDYFGFMYKADTKSVSELLTEDKLKDINNNPYLVDFLKFVLVKDQNYRPNIETITKRFEHVHALLVGFGATNSMTSNILSNISKRYNSGCVDQSIEICTDLIGINSESQTDNQLVGLNEFRSKYIPNLIKITEEIYIADYNYTENNLDLLFKLGITHIISWTKTKNKEVEKIFFLNILDNQNDNRKTVFHHLFKVMDFLRHCMVYRGVTLFVDDYQFVNFQLKPNFVMRNLIILSISYMLHLSAYDAWTYINSKLLFFWIPPDNLTTLSLWVMNQSMVSNFVFSHPVLKCLCGGCIMVVKRSFTNINLMNVKTCTCSTKHKNTEYSECPSNGCQEYIQEIKKCYGLNYEYLQWGNIVAEDFIIGPGELCFSNNSNIKKIVGCSRGLDDNLIQHSVNEKKSIKLTTKKFSWNLYKCRICQVWMYASSNERFQILVNNIHNFNKKAEKKKLLIKSNHLKNLKLAKLL